MEIKIDLRGVTKGVSWFGIKRGDATLKIGDRNGNDIELAVDPRVLLDAFESLFVDTAFGKTDRSEILGRIKRLLEFLKTEDSLLRKDGV